MEIRDITKTIEAKDSKFSHYVHEILPAIRNEDRSNRVWVKTFALAFTKYVLPELVKRSDEYGDIAADMCEVCLRKSNTDFLRLTESILGESKFIKWERRPDQATRMVGSLSDLVMSPRYSETDVNVIRSCVSQMMTVFTETKLAGLISEAAMRVLVACYRERNKLGVAVGRVLVDCYDLELKASTEQIAAIYDGMLQWVRDINLNEHAAESSFFCATICCFENEALLAPMQLSRIFDYCISKELSGPSFSGYADLAHDIIIVTVKKHYPHADLITDFIAGTVRLMNCGVKSLEDDAGSAMANIYQQIDLLAPYADDVLQVYLDCKGGLSLGMVLKPLYLAAPDRILCMMDKIHESFEDMDDIEKTYVYVLLHEIAKKHPEEIIPSLPIIVHDLRSASNVHLAFMVIAEVSNKYPAEISKYYKKLLRTWDTCTVPEVTMFAAKTLGNIGRLSGEDADRCLRAMAKRLQMVGPENKSYVLAEMERIVRRYGFILESYRANAKGEHSAKTLNRDDSVKLVLDYLEDRIPQVLANIAEADEETETAESPETDAQSDTTGGKQEEDMEPSARTVAVTKPITRLKLPKWSGDVARILNVECEFDWRYLAIRLGYSSEDVRNCALLSDPTIAVLAEWYATHGNTDATVTILTALQDMGRTEAVEIVEKTLAAEDRPSRSGTAEQDQYDEPSSKISYDIFISYQWDAKAMATDLHSRLTESGYSCWMNPLLRLPQNQITTNHITERAIGVTKIFVACISTKYFLSQDCKHQFNLADVLKKPIVLVLSEKDMTWPIAAPLSSTLARFNYVDMREGMTNDKYTLIQGDIDHCFRSLNTAPSSPSSPSPSSSLGLPVTPTEGKDLTSFSDLKAGFQRSGSWKQSSGMKQVYNKTPQQSSTYIKQMPTSESSRSFPERSPSSRGRKKHHPHRADSDQAIPRSRSRRSAICSIV